MSISDLNLGATLYTPATINVLKAKAMITGVTYPDLKSLVICLEDSIAKEQVAPALANLKKILSTFKEEALTRNIVLFIRPRNIDMAKQILAWGFNDCFDGFVAPKFHLGEPWLDLMADGHYLMPTCEHKDYFNAHYRAELRDWLNPHKDKILCLRIGGNDLLSCLGLRRPKNHTIYETPIGTLIQNMVAEFGSHGYTMNSPVFEHYSNISLLEKEVGCDLVNGLYTKTAIHPCQISHIQSLYRVDEKDLTEANLILSMHKKASVGVCASGSGSMLEPATHVNWAKRTIERARVYGVTNQQDLCNFG